MSRPNPVPTIQVGDWEVRPSDDGDPELFYRDFDVAPGVSSAELRKAALDLMKLARQLGAVGL